MRYGLEETARQAAATRVGKGTDPSSKRDPARSADGERVEASSSVRGRRVMLFSWLPPAPDAVMAQVLSTRIADLRASAML